MEEEPNQKFPDDLVLEILNKLEDQNDKMRFATVCSKFRRVWCFTKCWNDSMTWVYSFPKIIILLGNLYFAEFDNEHDNTYKIGQIGSNETQTQKIPRSKTFFEHARNMFQRKLEKNQRRVKILTIKGTCPINLRKIEHFPQLHTLIISGRENLEICQELLLKTGDSLKSLTIRDVCNADNGVDFGDQIFRVSKYLSIDFNLTATQLMNLNAKRIEMPIGNLQPLDIYRFIRTWMDGNRILEKCVWDLKDSEIRPLFPRIVFFLFESKMESSCEHHQLYILGIRGNGRITYRKDDFLQFEVV